MAADIKLAHTCSLREFAKRADVLGGLEARSRLGVMEFTGDASGGGARLGQQRVVASKHKQWGSRAQEHRWIADLAGEGHSGVQVRQRLLLAMQCNQRLGTRLQPRDLILDTPALAALRERILGVAQCFFPVSPCQGDLAARLRQP